MVVTAPGLIYVASTRTVDIGLNRKLCWGLLTQNSDVKPVLVEFRTAIMYNKYKKQFCLLVNKNTWSCLSPGEHLFESEFLEL